MLVFASIVVALLVGAMAWRIVAPRSYWWAVNARQYRDPEANEPSDPAYASQRVAAAFGVVFLVVLWGVILWILNTRSELDSDGPRSEYDRCVSEERAVDDEQIDFLTPEERCDHLLPRGERP